MALDLEALALDEEPPGPSHAKAMSSNVSTIDPIAQLREMFPSLKEIDFTTTVDSHGGDLERAIEELQNLQYLEETGQRLKGIDGFFSTDEHGRKPRRGKKKTQAGLSRASSLSGSISYLSFCSYNRGLTGCRCWSIRVCEARPRPRDGRLYAQAARGRR